jgi:Protein of unknown function (DUF3102)
MTRAALTVTRRGDTPLDHYAQRITAALHHTVEGIFETGHALTEARDKLDHGEWTRLFEERRVPISVDTAKRYMRVWAARDRLVNRAPVHGLPPSYSILDQLAALPEDTLARAVEAGRITPDLQRADVPKLRAEFDRAAAVPAPQVPTWPPVAAWGGAREFELVNKALAPAHDLANTWPAEAVPDVFIHQVTQLLKRVQRLRGTTDADQIPAG